MDEVAGVIEVSLTDEIPEMVMRCPATPSDSKGKHEIAILPRYARHLANLLVEYAEAAEASTERKNRSSVLEERPHYILIGFRPIGEPRVRSKRST